MRKEKTVEGGSEYEFTKLSFGSIAWFDFLWKIQNVELKSRKQPTVVVIHFPGCDEADS